MAHHLRGHTRQAVGCKRLGWGLAGHCIMGSTPISSWSVHLIILMALTVVDVPGELSSRLVDVNRRTTMHCRDSANLHLVRRHAAYASPIMRVGRPRFLSNPR